MSDRNRRAVAAAATAGWHVVLASARWYQLVERTAHDIGVVGPVIACSGADVRRLGDGVDLFDVRLPAPFAAALYELCDDADGLALVCQDREVVLRSAAAAPRDEPPEICRVPSLAGVERTPRCALVYGDELNALVRDTLLPHWEDDVRFLT